MAGPLCYIGGKNRLANTIIPLFPPHTAYVEPFAGGAQVFFHKKPSKVELLNDLDGEIVNFFRICQSHHEELLRTLRFHLASRQWFKILQATPPESLTDIQRAARFFYLQRTAYGGLVRRHNYASRLSHPANFNPARIPAIIEKTYERLKSVQIESLPYEQILKKFDRPTTLFYLDPPYWGKQLYRFNFSDADFTVLRDHLTALTGKFILSLNDIPPVRKLFSQFNIIPVTIAYTAQQKPGKRFPELLIKNY
jgi:DNA adenine methylase